MDVINTTETTALGAAMLAAEGVGLRIEPGGSPARHFVPDLERAARYEEGYRYFLKLETMLSSMSMTGEQRQL